MSFPFQDSSNIQTTIFFVLVLSLLSIALEIMLQEALSFYLRDEYYKIWDCVKISSSQKIYTRLYRSDLEQWIGFYFNFICSKSSNYEQSRLCASDVHVHLKLCSITSSHLMSCCTDCATSSCDVSCTSCLYHRWNMYDLCFSDDFTVSWLVLQKVVEFLYVVNIRLYLSL